MDPNVKPNIIDRHEQASPGGDDVDSSTKVHGDDNGDSQTITTTTTTSTSNGGHFKIRLPPQAQLHNQETPHNSDHSITNGNVKSKMLPPSVPLANNNSNNNDNAGVESNGDTHSDSDATTTSPPGPSSATGQLRAPYKSFRKKYKKMRATFDSVMHKNDALFYSDLRARRMIRRLSMQNAYLLEILLDLNNSATIMPPEARIPLDPTSDSDILKRLDELYPPATAGSDRTSHENPDISLRDALTHLWSNFMNVDVDCDFDNLHNAVNYNTPPDAGFDFTNYVYRPIDDDDDDDVDDDATPAPGKKKPIKGDATDTKKGPPTIHHYRYNEDGVLVDQESGQVVPVVGSTTHQSTATNTTNEPAKNVDMVFTTPDFHDRTERNPMSALAWLRVNQPQVFLQEIEEQKRSHRKQQQQRQQNHTHPEGGGSKSSTTTQQGGKTGGGGKKSSGNKKSLQPPGGVESDIEPSGGDTRKRKASFDNNNNNNNHNQAMSVSSLVAKGDDNNSNNNNNGYAHIKEGSKRPKLAP